MEVPDPRHPGADVIETIFGFEILDEKDKVADLQLHARNLWKERARKMGLTLDETDDPGMDQ